MKRYDTYKDSGVQWLGEIPGHWGCVPLKYFIETQSGTAINVKELDDRGTYPVYGGGSQIGFCNKYNCEETEIIVGRVGAKCGCVTFPNKKVWATDNALIIKTNLYPRFTAFVLVAADLNRLNAANAQPLITGTKIKHVRIALPPLSEQHSIVSYLDDKCGKIDEWVTKKQKEVEHLQELKQRVIADAVTRGLNPHVKMKATNIPWLKEIPEHWERNKVLRLFKQIGSGTTPSSGDASLYADEGTPWLQSGDFNNNEINSTSKFLTDKALDNYSLKLYNSGGVVIAMYGASIGKVGLLNIATTVNQACCVLSDSDHLLQKFSFYVFINEKDNLVKKSKGGTQPNISQEIIKSHYIPVPPLSEQRSIVSYLDAKCSKIDKLIANITKEIECIKEYKQRLISDVVTGQIKVC